MLSVSVITPTLNEEDCIHGQVRHLSALGQNLEVIVADGGSTDRTVDRVPPSARVVTASRGRGAQMNAGAAVATGEVLWFVHADCRPHPASLPALRAALADPAVAGGAFEYGLDEPGALYRLVEVVSNRKNRLFRLLYGDMGIFVRRGIFRRMSGYREIPLMEDMDFGRRLRQEGRVVILPQRIATSARRWRAEGAAWNLIRNWALQVAWLMGADPARLTRWYSFTSTGSRRDAERRGEKT
jgi:rSAM/selenodomain-associated transferase 2